MNCWTSHDVKATNADVKGGGGKRNLILQEVKIVPCYALVPRFLEWVARGYSSHYSLLPTVLPSNCNHGCNPVHLCCLKSTPMTYVSFLFPI